MSARNEADGSALPEPAGVLRVWGAVMGILLGLALVAVLTDALGQRVCGREAVEASPPGHWLVFGCGR